MLAASGHGVVESLCVNLRIEEDYEYVPPILEAAPNGFTLHKRGLYQGRTIWIFQGRQVGDIQETLIVVEWGIEQVGSFPPHYTCAVWAANIAVGNTPGKDSLRDVTMAYLIRQEDGGYDLLRPWLEPDREKRQQMTIATSDLVALSQKVDEGVPRFTFPEANGRAENKTGYFSAVATVISQPKGRRFVTRVLAGATAGTTDDFWRLVGSIDEFTSNYAARPADK